MSRNASWLLKNVFFAVFPVFIMNTVWAQAIPTRYPKNSVQAIMEFNHYLVFKKKSDTEKALAAIEKQLSFKR